MRSQNQLLLKLPLYKLFRQLGFPIIKPFSYTLTVSYKCPSRCKTCNVWKKNPAKEMTLNQWEKVFQSIGKSAFWLTFSGGEPYAFKHMEKFAEFTEKYCQPKIINIPTNSIMWSVMKERTEKILKIISPQTDLVINFSLDEIGSDHDKIRGIRGNFEMFEKAWKNIVPLKQKYPNLKLGIHSVISNYNVKKIPALYEYAMEKYQPDQYITELAEERKELNNFGLNITPLAKDYEKTAIFLINQIKKDFKKWKGVNKIAQIFRVRYYNFVVNFLKTKEQQIPSYAGFATCQIDPLGYVWECAVYGNEMGYLKNFEYDFERLWQSKKADTIRKMVKNNHPCPLANESYTNMLLDFTTLFKIGLNILKNKI